MVSLKLNIEKRYNCCQVEITVPYEAIKNQMIEVRQFIQLVAQQTKADLISQEVEFSYIDERQEIVRLRYDRVRNEVILPEIWQKWRSCNQNGDKLPKVSMFHKVKHQQVSQQEAKGKQSQFYCKNRNDESNQYVNQPILTNRSRSRTSKTSHTTDEVNEFAQRQSKRTNDPLSLEQKQKLIFQEKQAQQQQSLSINLDNAVLPQKSQISINNLILINDKLVQTLGRLDLVKHFTQKGYGIEQKIVTQIQCQDDNEKLKEVLESSKPYQDQVSNQYVSDILKLKIEDKKQINRVISLLIDYVINYIEQNNIDLQPSDQLVSQWQKKDSFISLKSLQKQNQQYKGEEINCFQSMDNQSIKTDPVFYHETRNEFDRQFFRIIEEKEDEKNFLDI